MGCHIIKQNQTTSKFNMSYCNYQPLSHYKLSGVFYSLAINSTNSLLVVASDCEIQIFYFKMGNLKQLQVIQLQAYNIYLLTFCKQKAFFLSAQSDSSLAIWNSNLISKPKFICKLFGHSKEIICIALHPLAEELIVTGSHDSLIKFWYIQQRWYCRQTISKHTDSVTSLIFHSTGNQLISCSKDKSILIFEGSNQKLWQIKQHIQLPNYGYRSSYISNNMFIFHPNTDQDDFHLQIFKLNPSQQEYEEFFQILIKGKKQFCYYYFPCTYNNSKCIFLTKNGCFINILTIIPSTVKSRFYFQLDQTIEFENKYINGILSDDGDFLIIWDEESEQLQIRQLQQHIQTNFLQ
ncbi:unnamed protein product [Paramecium octaurelia]|uniref:Uncharacterized protein n=1 Tax=Paramecium octaurelia TaxID=43137 RepID=A0A8S1X4E0_PAROT|nr:unnamed protein product [Paramecium octaurelia]